MDATTKRLLKRLEEIDGQRVALRRERDAITTALSVAGVRPPDASHHIYTHSENQYGIFQPFKSKSLSEACLIVLRDQPKSWLTKTQVEYLVARGGYQFSTDDTINSVSVTLRRLAAEGLCEAHKGKGTRASTYRFVRERDDDDVKESRTTSE
ncbi:MAG: hypothetical protein ACRD22_08595 [Terriglobia bacterium]